MNRSYTIILKLKYYPGYSTSCPTYLSHHLMNPMVQIFSTLCAYFIYGTVGDVRYKGGMLPTNVFFDGTQTCHIQGFFHWWPLPPASPSTFIFLSRNSSGHSMMKNIYNRQYTSCNCPSLTPIVTMCTVSSETSPYKLSYVISNLALWFYGFCWYWRGFSPLRRSHTRELPQ